MTPSSALPPWVLLALPLLVQSATAAGHPARQDFRPVEGGGESITVDTKAPLPGLIQRLGTDWQEVETGKAYWIGYTRDMYSIAAHGDDAIGPLLAFARGATSLRAKIGAAWTLHLIGIDRRVAGRTMEEFRNAKARQALVSMLADRTVQEQVLLLLIRNPWPSDLPDIFKHLASDTPHAWAFVKALDRYGIRGAPVHQELPPAVGRLVCYAQFEGDDKFAPVVRALERSLRGRLVVDADVQPKQTLERRAFGTGILGGGVASVLEGFTGCSYSYFGDRIEYYTQGDEVHICSIGTARRRWLSWYEKHRSDIVADGPRNPF